MRRPIPHADGDWDYINLGTDVELADTRRETDMLQPRQPHPWVPYIDRRVNNETAPCGGPCGQFVLPAELCECNDGEDPYCPVCCRKHHQGGWPFNGDRSAA